MKMETTLLLSWSMIVMFITLSFQLIVKKYSNAGYPLEWAYIVIDKSPLYEYGRVGQSSESVLLPSCEIASKWNHLCWDKSCKGGTVQSPCLCTVWLKHRAKLSN